MRGIVALALCLVPAAARAQDATRPLIAIGAYAEALERIADAVDRGDASDATDRASALEAQDVAFGGERLRPDPALLAAVHAKTWTHPATLSRHLRELAAALRAAAAGQEAPPPDPALVERLRAQAAIAPGGEVADPEMRPLTIPDWIVEVLTTIGAWIADWAARIWRWLARFWPRTGVKDAPTGGAALLLTMSVVAVAVIALVLLAIRTVRRGPRRAATAPSPRTVVSADEDPLSRESNEWERYARELAAAGRLREAVRAWYHAVLSTLFRTGVLEPRKGRTNWEHVSRLAPELRWRPEFIDITRRFEREWYGRDESSAEALGHCARLASGILAALRGEAA
jgi:hypothetical protein